MPKRKTPMRRVGKGLHRKAELRADRAWARNAKHRLGWCCAVCGRPDQLETHHFQPKKTFPKLRYDRRNAVVLCGPHHRYDNDLSAHHSPAWPAWFQACWPEDFKYLMSFKPNDSIKRSPAELTAIAESFEADNRLYDSMSEAA